MMQGQLFDNFSENLLPKEGEVINHGQIFGQSEADSFLDFLLKKTPWKHDEVVMFGKEIVTARRVAWFGNQGCDYTYSGRTRSPLAWTPELLAIKEQVEAHVGVIFNSCLLNLYDDGSQGMGWHQDNEKELGPNPTIASVSFGAERRFDFRHSESKEKVAVQLTHGSLLVMKGETQSHWQHQIAKTKKVTTPRVNLTFRTIL